MGTTTQFSMRMEPELIRRIDDEAEHEYKSRTELIKDAILRYLNDKQQKEHLKKVAAELWLQGELSEVKLKKVLNAEEIEDLTFGKRWIEDTIHEARH